MDAKHGRSGRKEQRRASVSHPEGCQTHCAMCLCVCVRACVSSGERYRNKIGEKRMKTGGRVKYRGPDARGQSLNVCLFVCVCCQSITACLL